jgi:pimeloyl-ACP methyl ester carboxylesterase
LFFQIPWLPERLLSAGRGRALRRMMKSTAIRREAITREDLEEYQKTWTFSRVRAGINYYRALFRRPRWALKFHRERKVQCPVCVVWADKDMALSLIQTTGLERYCQNPPEVRVIENCGHWIQQEAPDELYEIMAGFFKNSGSGD